MDEYLWEFTNLQKAFPLLDMIIAVTDWNEMPPYAWDLQFNTPIEKYTGQEFYMEYPDFIENIEIGFWLHNGALEILNKARAQQIYKEYEVKYEESNKAIYVSNYYNDNKIIPANFEYLKRLVAAYGVDPEKELADYPWKDWLNGAPKGKGG